MVPPRRSKHVCVCVCVCVSVCLYSVYLNVHTHVHKCEHVGICVNLFVDLSTLLTPIKNTFQEYWIQNLSLTQSIHAFCINLNTYSNDSVERLNEFFPFDFLHIQPNNCINQSIPLKI